MAEEAGERKGPGFAWGLEARMQISGLQGKNLEEVDENGASSSLGPSGAVCSWRGCSRAGVCRVEEGWGSRRFSADGRQTCLAGQGTA